MIFKIIKDWFDFSPDKRDELTHTYKKYHIDLDLLTKKMASFLKEQYDEVQTKRFDSGTVRILAKRTSLLRRHGAFSAILVQFSQKASDDDLVLKVVLDKKPKHDLWTVTDPWQNGIREDKIDFRNFLLNSIVEIISSLKNSKRRRMDNSFERNLACFSPLVNLRFVVKFNKKIF